MNDPGTRAFAAAVQRAKDRRSWSVRDLAAQSGVTVGTADRACTTGSISLANALRIARTLDLASGDLGGGDGR
jgi:hypothetical protein